MSSEAGDIRAELGLGLAQFQEAVNRVEKRLAQTRVVAKKEGDAISAGLFGGLGQAAASLAPGLGVATVAAAIKASLSHYDDLADAALRLGETTTTLQRVEHAAKEMASVSLEGLVGEFLKLEKALGDPENEKGAAALAHYGVTAEQLISLPLDQKILAISEAFTQARREGTGYNDLVDLLGKSAGAIIPLLSQSKEAIQQAFGEAAVIDDKDVQQLAALNDQLDRYYETAKALLALNLGKIFDSFKFNLTWLTEGSDAALSQAGMAEGDAGARANKIRHDRQRQAKNTGALHEAAADEAAAKKREDALKRLEQLERQLRDASIEALPDEDKLAALQEEIANFFATLPKDFVSEYGASIEGMRQLAEEMKQAGEFKIAEGILKQVQEIQGLVIKADEVQTKLDEKAQRAAEKRSQELARANELEREFMTPGQKLDSLKAELRDIFSKADVKLGDLQALKDKDPEAYAKALKNMKEGAEASGGLAQKVGGIQNAVNIFTGRGANQLAEEQRDLLRDANAYLKALVEQGKPDNQPQPMTAVFAYP